VLIFLGILIFVLPYLYLYAKSVDESSMVKSLKTSGLREGDWLYRDVRIGKKTIRASWDGLKRREITLLRKHKKRVRIREGVAFTPTFLISFVLFLYFWYNELGNPFW
jgi:hypothetical protein